MFALISNGTVWEIKDTPTEVSPSLKWVDITNYPEVKVGYSFDIETNEYTPPVPKTPPPDEKAEAIAAVTEKAEKITSLTEASTKYGLGLITKEALQQAYDEFKSVTAVK